MCNLVKTSILTGWFPNIFVIFLKRQGLHNTTTLENFPLNYVVKSIQKSNEFSELKIYLTLYISPFPTVVFPDRMQYLCLKTLI